MINGQLTVFFRRDKVKRLNNFSDAFVRTMELAIILLVVVSGISCREHARYLKHSHLKDVHSAKKFNILAHSKNEVFTLCKLTKGLFAWSRVVMVGGLPSTLRVFK